MSRPMLVVLFIAVAVAVCGVGFAQDQEEQAAPQPAKWEYEVVLLSPSSATATERLNEMAAQGWELQECYQVTRGQSRVTTNAVMKRPAQ